MHVLIIEDEALLASKLQCFLEALGADTCALAETEDEAVRMAFARRPDLITVDMSLHEGSAPEAVRAIRDRMGDVPVVYLSGAESEAQPPDDHTQTVGKPILWLDFADAVHQRANLPAAV